MEDDVEFEVDPTPKKPRKRSARLLRFLQEAVERLRATFSTHQHCLRSPASYRSPKVAVHEHIDLHPRLCATTRSPEFLRPEPRATGHYGIIHSRYPSSSLVVRVGQHLRAETGEKEHQNISRFVITRSSPAA